jgi:hypothetical protein
MTAPTVLFERKGTRYNVRFQYHARLVELIKTIPSWARTYDPPTKTWTVDRQFAESLAADYRRVGCKIVGLEAEEERKRKAPPPPPPPPPAIAPPLASSWAAAMLARADELDPDLGKSLFRALAKVLHSDVGGDHVMMSELNIARKARNEAQQQEGRAG